MVNANESGKTRTIEEIQQKISDGSAVVMTAHELCKAAKSEENISFDDVDVVTTATKGLMSGTSAILAFRVTKPKEFKKARKVLINDIPCYVGPCPNETLGMVDLILHATDHSNSNPKYGAGHLLRELVEGKDVRVNVITDEGRFIERNINLNEMYYAKMLGIRHAFRNYNAFINPSGDEVSSIFTVTGMEPNEKEITICGCGVVNPLENDPHFEALGIGSPLLMNGSLGFLIGTGTRSSPQRPNLMTIAPIHDMKPEYMGGFVTNYGPEVITSIGTAIPILTEKTFENLKILEENCPLNIVDIVGRRVLKTIDYSKVWNIEDENYSMRFDTGHCGTCELNTPNKCPVIQFCPTNAFTIGKGIDRTRCFNCGTCKKVCINGAFHMKLGSIKYDDKKVKITLRQSDRCGANKLMKEIKQMILKGEFPIVKPTAKPITYTDRIETKREQVKK